MDSLGTAHGGSSAYSSLSNSTYFKLAALGGFVGAILMALAMMGATAAMGLGYTAMLCAMATAILGLNPAGGLATTIPGLILHLIDGVIIGVIVVGVTLVAKHKLLITGVKNGLVIGLLGGFVVWLVFGLPMLLFAMPPAMAQVAATMMPMQSGMTMAQADSEAMMMLQGMMGQLAGAFLLGHLFWGGALGAIVGFGISKRATSKKFVCDNCGASFSTREELMEHAKKAHPMPAK